MTWTDKWTLRKKKLTTLGMSRPKSNSDHLQNCSVFIKSFLTCEKLHQSGCRLKQWWTAAAAKIMGNQLSALPLSQPFWLVETSRHAPLSCLCSHWVVLFALDNFCTALSLGLSLQSINIWSSFDAVHNGGRRQQRSGCWHMPDPFKWTLEEKKLLTSSEGHNAHSVELSSQTAESKRIRRLNGNYKKGADCLLTFAGFGLVWLALFPIGVKKKNNNNATDLYIQYIFVLLCSSAVYVHLLTYYKHW